uniref:Uncharacterized protein n=1 Tax=Panagrolaimus sp. ES5 TaxID=591445 RepID=A0AC34GTB9_9BILA
MPPSNRDLIILVKNNVKDVLITSISIQNYQSKEEETIPCNPQNKTGCLKLFSQLQSMLNLNQVKAIVFYQFDELSTIKLSETYEFRLKCREFCEKNEIFCYFLNPIHWKAFGAIAETETMVKEGETVMVLFSKIEFFGIPSAFKMIREKDGYRILEIVTTNSTIFGIGWKNQFIGDFKPKRIILLMEKWIHDYRAYVDQLNNYFKNICSDVVDTGIEEEKLFKNAIINNVLHLMDEKISPYNVGNVSFCRYGVNIGETCLIKFNIFDALPIEESVVIDVNPEKSVTLQMSSDTVKTDEVVEEIQLSKFKFLKVKVLLKIDINSFYHYKIVPVDKDGNEITKFNIADYSPILPIEKARICFGAQEYTVSVFKDDKEYLINDFDGLEETPIYIAFTEKKPITGRAALEVYSKKPEFVVFDLIKLGSVSTANINDPKWRFRLFKNSDNDSMMVTMQTLEGEKDSSVAFLLAFFLRNGIKRILKETKQKMKEIEIEFNGFSANETLKNNFIEAAKYLKINVVFV